MSNLQPPGTFFIDKNLNTPIVAAWLNDVNNFVYNPSLKTLIGGVTVGSITIDHNTPNQTVFIADTKPLDWATGPGRMTVGFELTSNAYFAANPNGHFAVVLRQDPALVGTSVRGQGIACGNATGFDSPDPINPTSLAETWMNNVVGAPGAHYIWNSSGIAPKFALQDGVAYKFIVESTKTLDGNRYLRYRIWSKQTPSLNWLAEIDTGDILDHNVWADLTKSGLMFAHVFESNLQVWSLAITNCVVTWGPADQALPDQTIKADPTTPVRVVVVGDSMSATNSMMEPAWPDLMRLRMGALNAPIEMHNLAKDGWTFHKANTVAQFGSLTQIQQAVVLQPDVVIVALGANDAVLNIEGRSLVQCEADANTAFSALRTALPQALIIYASELLYDVDNFPAPSVTLKNKGVPVYLWQRKTAGILNGMVTSEVLDDSVAAQTKTNFGNWVTLDGYIKGLTAVTTNFTLPHWKAARLGLVGVDNIHLTAMGQLFLAAAAVMEFQGDSALSRLFSNIGNQSYWPWNDPTQVFSAWLTASGDGYVDAAYDSQVTTAARNAGLWSRLNPDAWYFPSKAVTKSFPTSYTSDSFTVPYWSVMNARPNTAVEVSVGGGAFASAGQSTDAYGCAIFPYVAGQIVAGSYTTRYRVGDEVYGPFTTTVSAPAEPYLFAKQAGNQATSGADTFNKPSLATTVEATGIGWATATATVLRAGRYSLQAQVTIAGVPDTGAVEAIIYKNGVRFMDGQTSFMSSGGTGYVASIVACSLRLVVNDTIELYCFQLGGGGALNISNGAGQSTYLTMSWVGF